MSRRRSTAWGALGITTIVVFAFAPNLSVGDLDLGVTLLTYIAIAQAWNVLAGSGQISLGSAAFVATGGYAAALMLAHTSANYVVGLLAAAACSAALALLLSVPLLRLRGDYFAVGTLAIATAVQALLNNWPWAGGAGGLILPVDRVPSGGNLYQLAAVVCALSMALALYVKTSNFGLRLTAISDHESAAAGLGVSVFRHRLLALVGSSTIVGLAGAVVAYQFVAISPTGIANLAWSLNAVLMAIVGGAGTVMGPIVGVLVVYYGLTRQLEDTQTVSQIIQGTLLIIIVRFAPVGVWPLLCRGARFLLPSDGSPKPERAGVHSPNDADSTGVLTPTAASVPARAPDSRADP